MKPILHLDLSDNLVAQPDVNVPVWELGSAQPKPFDIVHAVGSGFVKKAILAEAAYKRVALEGDAHQHMCIEIDWLKYEPFGFHNLVRLTKG